MDCINSREEVAIKRIPKESFGINSKIIYCKMQNGDQTVKKKQLIHQGCLLM